MGTEGGLVKPRDMNPSSLSPLQVHAPGHEDRRMTPRAGAELSQGRSPGGQAFRRGLEQPGGAGGGRAPTTRQVTILLSRRAKLLSLNTLSQQAHFLFPFQSRCSPCVSSTARLQGSMRLRVSPLTVGRSHPRGCVVTDGPQAGPWPQGEQLLGVRGEEQKARPRREGRVSAMETRPGGRDG